MIREKPKSVSIVAMGATSNQYVGYVVGVAEGA